MPLRFKYLTEVVDVAPELVEGKQKSSSKLSMGRADRLGIKHFQFIGSLSLSRTHVKLGVAN